LCSLYYEHLLHTTLSVYLFLSVCQELFFFFIK
jgi:hypothetical protein